MIQTAFFMSGNREEKKKKVVRGTGFEPVTSTVSR